MLIRLELEEGSSDLFVNVLVQSVLATFTIELVEDIFVLFDLLLRGEDFKTNDLITDGALKLLASLFTVDDLSELVSLFHKQVTNKAIVELLLESLKHGALSASILLFGRLVKLEVLSELLEEFEYVLGCLKLHGAKEERSDHLVSQLNVTGLLTDEQETVSILFESLASLQEHHKSLEGAFLDLKAILEQIFHR